MLKKKLFGSQNIKFLAMAVIAALALVLALVGCGDAGGGPAGGGPGSSITYTGSKDGETYTLEIIENLNRAAYTPQSGDNFKLIEVISTKSITGVVEISADGITLTLIPSSGGGDPITVTISGTDISSIQGTNLKWGDGSAFIAPGTLTSDGDGGMDWPPDAMLSQVGLGGLSNPGVTDLNYTFYPDGGHGASIEMYFSGNINTKNNILSYFASKGWEYDQEYFENNNEYHYVTDGEPSYNVFFHWSTWSGGDQSGSILAIADYGW